ncbi:MAG: hypothetical protein FRX49_01057 [Trebouxia sp. A1-2]|nr:MAG: hypothetical protein FRX49_01057 [Trebouxia sp. A1-2]
MTDTDTPEGRRCAVIPPWGACVPTKCTITWIHRTMGGKKKGYKRGRNRLSKSISITSSL